MLTSRAQSRDLNKVPKITASKQNLAKPLARILDPSALDGVTAIEKTGHVQKAVNPSPANLWQSTLIVEHALNYDLKQKPTNWFHSSVPYEDVGK